MQEVRRQEEEMTDQLIVFIDENSQFRKAVKTTIMSHGKHPHTLMPLVIRVTRGGKTFETTVHVNSAHDDEMREKFKKDPRPKNKGLGPSQAEFDEMQKNRKKNWADIQAKKKEKFEKQNPGKKYAYEAYTPLEDNRYHHIWLNPDKTSPIIAKYLDSKNRPGSVRNNDVCKADEGKKWARTEEMIEQFPTLLKRMTKDSVKGKESATVARLIALTGVRVGGEGDTKADRDAYGATTLQARHFKIKGDKITIDHEAKKSKDNHWEVKDSALAKTISERLSKLKPNQKVFVTDHNEVRDYIKSISDGCFVTKDLRTYVATAEAIRYMEEMPPVDATLKSYKKVVKAICEHVGKRMNDTPGMVKKSYILPRVFESLHEQLVGGE